MVVIMHRLLKTNPCYNTAPSIHFHRMSELLEDAIPSHTESVE